MQALRARRTVGKSTPWLCSLLFIVACSGSKGIDFFEPEEGVGGTTGGSSGTDAGGSSTGGSSGDGALGGTSGDSSGGTGADPTGGTAGETGGTGTQGGTGADAGMGGSSTTGGQGGDAGSAVGGTSMGGAGTGGSGSGMGGAGMGGAGMGGAGTGGAGMGGAGKGGMAGAAGCTPTAPATERCDGVDNNCMGGVDEGMACPMNCTGATRAGHWYIFCSFENASGMTNGARTWAEAEAFCEQRNLGLVFIESAEENAFIVSWITRMMLEGQVWMGANDREPAIGLSNEGNWVWGSANNAVPFWDGDDNGDPVMNRYNDWATGEPNNEGNEDCGVFSANHDFAWDDRTCLDEYENFVCESS